MILQKSNLGGGAIREKKEKNTHLKVLGQKRI